jgi:hypothetical protein
MLAGLNPESTDRTSRDQITSTARSRSRCTLLVADQAAEAETGAESITMASMDTPAEIAVLPSNAEKKVRWISVHSDSRRGLRAATTPVNPATATENSTRVESSSLGCMVCRLTDRRCRGGIAPPDSAEPERVDAKTVQR